MNIDKIQEELKAISRLDYDAYCVLCARIAKSVQYIHSIKSCCRNSVQLREHSKDAIDSIYFYKYGLITRKELLEVGKANEELAYKEANNCGTFTVDWERVYATNTATKAACGDDYAHMYRDINPNDYYTVLETAKTSVRAIVEAAKEKAKEEVRLASVAASKKFRDVEEVSDTDYREYVIATDVRIGETTVKTAIKAAEKKQWCNIARLLNKYSVLL